MRRVVPALATALAVLAAGGCGGDDEEPASPASVVPADALVYVETVLRPEGEDRTAIESPLAALLDVEDPGALIVEQLDRASAEDGSAITYAEDIEPWLGERGAIFFDDLFPESGDESGDVEEGTFGEADFEGAIVVQSTDADAAQGFVDQVRAEGDLGEAEIGLVGDNVVFGSAAGFDAVAEAEGGGEALADDPDYAGTAGAGAADSAASLFVDVPGIVAAAETAGELEPDERPVLDSLLGEFAEQPLTAELSGETTGFALEVSFGAAGGATEAEESALLRELPEDTWLAAGLPDVGELVDGYLSAAADLGASAAELRDLDRGFRGELGLDTADVLAALGDGALFANGEGVFGTGGGVVFEADDPAATAELVAALERSARRSGEQVRPLEGDDGESGFALSIDEAPGAVNFVTSDDRLVIAYGDNASAAALEPDPAVGALADSEAFAEAEEALGSGYAVSSFVDFDPLADLLGLAATLDPSLQESLPYVESLDFAVSGSVVEGERERHRVFLGVDDVVADPSA
jgi:hypothetical protein